MLPTLKIPIDNPDLYIKAVKSVLKSSRNQVLN